MMRQKRSFFVSFILFLADGTLAKGFVQTPDSVVEFMVEELFRDKLPTVDSKVLDPGCGNGAFIDGILRWCQRESLPVPNILGVEFDGVRAAVARKRFFTHDNIRILEADFLTEPVDAFDYVIGNPPYVSITSLDLAERAKYRERFVGASGRFDLYLLFFEQAINSLLPGGRLVFITPEKFLYVGTARPLRRLLGSLNVESLHFIDEDTFDGFVTYPLISSVTASAPESSVDVTFRDGTSRNVTVPRNGESWLKAISARAPDSFGPTLENISERISCGIATGADSVFVQRLDQIPIELRQFVYPTISGRQISIEGQPEALDGMLVPYSHDGVLFREQDLGPLGSFLETDENKTKLLGRTCVGRKAWYAFHETPVPSMICRPKILCKDIGPDPFFVLDSKGDILPRHSVYFIIPKDPGSLQELFEYLNSAFAKQWLRDHCQRAAKGFVRLQSHILKQLPVPERLNTESGLLFSTKKSA